MKRKIAVTLLLLIVGIACCGCGVQTEYQIDDYHYVTYESEYDDNHVARDITYKKQADDCSPTVYITRYGKRYHKQYCSHAKRVYLFLTVWQAIDKGYTACYYCCY